jgi:hypothetical protein
MINPFQRVLAFSPQFIAGALGSLLFYVLTKIKKKFDRLTAKGRAEEKE